MSLFVAYHAKLYETLAKQGSLAESAHVSDELLAEYGALVALLGDRNKESQADINTQKSDLEESDRDRLLSLLFYFIANGLMAVNKEVRNAARQLDIALGQFKKIRYEADDTETGLIRSLLSACEEEQMQAAIDTLGVRQILADLAEANRRFEVIKAQRIQDRYARRQQTKAHEMRRQAEALWAEIQELIHASGVIASVTPGAEETAAFIRSLIIEMNANIVNFRTSWRQSEGQRNAQRQSPKREYSSSDTGSSHSLDVSSPGTSKAR